MSEAISSITRSPMPRNKIHMSICRINNMKRVLLHDLAGFIDTGDIGHDDAAHSRYLGTGKDELRLLVATIQEFTMLGQHGIDCLNRLHILRNNKNHSLLLRNRKIMNFAISDRLLGQRSQQSIAVDDSHAKAGMQGRRKVPQPRHSATVEWIHRWP